MWMERRTLLKALLASPVATRAALAAIFFAAKPVLAAPPTNMKDIDSLQKNWKSFVAAGTAVPAPSEPLKLSKEEWRKRLPPEAYKVLRDEGTERAGTSPLDHEKRPGVFVCAGCGLPVFTSEMKFDSGTGWPSFFTSIPGAFEMKKDFYLIYPRTEYHCIRCGGHHGHLFDDGPAPTNQRWCNNGVSLRFIPK
jgi:peptide-methionine (R)-S-oxide reductase